MNQRWRLLPYQKKWLADRSQIKVYEKSRQIGITWTEALGAVLNAAEDNLDTFYLGYNEPMTEGFIDHCADWVREIQADAGEPEPYPLADEKQILSFRIRFKNGHQILALSSKPRNLRSRSRSVAILDEAAHHDDFNELLKAAVALKMWGGQIHIISSHFGAENPFNLLVQDIRAGRLSYSLHRTTFDDALAQGLYRQICRTLGERWSPEREIEWRAAMIADYPMGADEELFVIPSQGGGVFLPAALIESRMHDGIPVLRAKGAGAFDELEPQLARVLSQLPANLQTAFGVDFGRQGDLSAFWFFQLQSNLVRRTVLLIELREVPHEIQRAVLFYALEHFPNR
jgi:phage FluMu gp28-like protein